MFINLRVLNYLFFFYTNALGLLEINVLKKIQYLINNQHFNQVFSIRVERKIRGKELCATPADSP